MPTPVINDRNGRRLERGARVLVESPLFSAHYTVVAFFKHDRGASVGLYHGALEDYQANFCIPYVPADPSGDEFVARELEVISEQKDTKEEGGS